MTNKEYEAGQYVTVVSATNERARFVKKTGIVILRKPGMDEYLVKIQQEKNRPEEIFFGHELRPGSPADVGKGGIRG